MLVGSSFPRSQAGVWELPLRRQVIISNISFFDTKTIFIIKNNHKLVYTRRQYLKALGFLGYV